MASRPGRRPSSFAHFDQRPVWFSPRRTGYAGRCAASGLGLPGLSSPNAFHCPNCAGAVGSIAGGCPVLCGSRPVHQHGALRSYGVRVRRVPFGPDCRIPCRGGIGSIAGNRTSVSIRIVRLPLVRAHNLACDSTVAYRESALVGGRGGRGRTWLSHPLHYCLAGGGAPDRFRRHPGSQIPRHTLVRRRARRDHAHRAAQSALASAPQLRGAGIEHRHSRPRYPHWTYRWFPLEAIAGTRVSVHDPSLDERAFLAHPPPRRQPLAGAGLGVSGGNCTFCRLEGPGLLFRAALSGAAGGGRGPVHGLAALGPPRPMGRNCGWNCDGCCPGLAGCTGQFSSFPDCRKNQRRQR